MHARHLLFAAAAFAAAAAARPAAAQAPAERLLATFAVSTARQPGAPTRLTVVDSAGTLVGRMWLIGDAAARPLAVSVDGADLVLRGDTPKGAAEFVLFGQNAHASHRALFGRWSIGDRQGQLRGSVKS